MKRLKNIVGTSLAGLMFLVFLLSFISPNYAARPALLAGTAKRSISEATGDLHDSLYVKVLLLKQGKTSLAIITLDVVAIERIGFVPKEYFHHIKSRLKKDYGIAYLLMNASHNHFDGFLNGGTSKLVSDLEERTMAAVVQAFRNMEPVVAGSGTGYEDRIAMNRRILLKDGSVFTIRHANPNMPDDQIAGVGKIDPEIGILRLDRRDGTPKAVLYNYACHPYTGVPDRGVTAEYPGFASRLIEETLGHGVMAFFIQGAAGDITEVLYKDVNNYRDAEVFGRMLGESTLAGWREIHPDKKSFLRVATTDIQLPLRRDMKQHLSDLKQQEDSLLKTLRGTSLNSKTFIPLYIKYTLDSKYPSYYAYRYLQEKKIGNPGLEKLDEMNRRNLKKYLQNMQVMDKLAQIEENKAFTERKEKEIEAFHSDEIKVEIMAVRVGRFVMVSFPAEAFAETGMKIKNDSPYPHTFMACYTNGYYHYAPDRESYRQWGYEVTNSILDPAWEEIYEKAVKQLLKKL